MPVSADTNALFMENCLTDLAHAELSSVSSGRKTRPEKWQTDHLNTMEQLMIDFEDGTRDADFRVNYSKALRGLQPFMPRISLGNAYENGVLLA